MQEYLIEAPHQEEDCVKQLESVLAQGEEVLEKFRWACPSGEHVGYTTISADSEEAARELLPDEVRQIAKLHPVARMKAKDVKELHQL